jgi:hypothetical protein
MTTTCVQVSGRRAYRRPRSGLGISALRNKRAEWEDYRRQVTEYERRRYLPVL